MKNTVVIVPPTGLFSEATIDMKTSNICDFMSFKDLQSEIISCNHQPLMVYYDSEQKNYGKNIFASTLFEKTINGNCVIRIVGSNLTIEMLYSIIKDFIAKKNNLS